MGNTTLLLLVSHGFETVAAMHTFRRGSQELPQVVRQVVEVVPKQVELPIREAAPLNICLYVFGSFCKAEAPES